MSFKQQITCGSNASSLPSNLLNSSVLTYAIDAAACINVPGVPPTTVALKDQFSISLLSEEFES